MYVSCLTCILSVMEKEYSSGQLPLAKAEYRFQNVLVALIRNNTASYVADILTWYRALECSFPLLKDN